MSKFSNRQQWTNTDLIAQEAAYGNILGNPAKFPKANVSAIADLWDAIHDEMMARAIPVRRAA